LIRKLLALVVQLDGVVVDIEKISRHSKISERNTFVPGFSRELLRLT
jgi:hypothetical protein